MKEHPYSRTARFSDDEFLGVSDLIREYASLPKNLPEIPGGPKYLFWNYALTFKVMEEQSYGSILDIHDIFDSSFTILCNHRKFEYYQWNVDTLLRHQVTDYKYDVVTCFGLLEFIGNDEEVFIKLARHCRIGGVVILTNDNETPKKYKIREYTYDKLLEISLLIEERGFEVYNQDTLNATDYFSTGRWDLHSVVIKRIGSLQYE